MKRTKWIALIGLMLSVMLCVPALAQTTGIAVDGKIYTFTGSEGTYEADGKTFIIGADTVTIKEPGKKDRVQSLSRSVENENLLVRDAAVFVESGTGDFDSAATYAEAIAVEDAQTAAYLERGDENAIGQTAVTEYSKSSYDVLEDVDPARFAEYAKFGLSYDAVQNALYYQGQRVRIFEDSYSLDDQACVALEHVDDQGTVDVKTTRDTSAKVYNADGSYDPSGTLTGLYVLSDAEFAARDLRDWTEPKQQSTAVEGAEMTPAEKEAMYAPYAAFGLDYDAKADTLTYQGKRVRQFMDIKQSNGEALNSGHFQGVMACIGGEYGEIDVETIRDFTKPDADGNGTLIGISMEQVR